jgi:hypothetical protein
MSFKLEPPKIDLADITELTPDGDFTSLQSETILKVNESSSPGEFHPQALPEPDVNLSIHPALIVQPH